MRYLKTRILLIAIMLIAFNGIAIVFGWPSMQLARFLNLSLEANFPTWFSSFLLLLSGLAFFYISSIEKSYAAKRDFSLLSFILIFMSCDETAMIHEFIGPIVNQYFLHLPLPKIQWVAALAPPSLALFLFVGNNLRKHMKDYPHVKRQMLIGTIFFCIGAFGIESGMQFIDMLDFETLRIEVWFEESFEIIGEVLFLFGVLDYLKVRIPGITDTTISCKKS